MLGEEFAYSCFSLFLDLLLLGSTQAPAARDGFRRSAFSRSRGLLVSVEAGMAR